jgi:hypothetical protein
MLWHRRGCVGVLLQEQEDRRGGAEREQMTMQVDG